MITLSARALSRAWLAVSGAASDDEHQDRMFRTVGVIEYERGVRLVACDGYWMMAHCWVPAWDILDEIHNDFPAGSGTIADDLGDDTVTEVAVQDHDLRVRELMRYLARATGGKGVLDRPITLDLGATFADEEAPALLPELEKPGALFELEGAERLLVPTFDGDWFNWRRVIDDIDSRDTLHPGQHIAPWMLTKIAKLAGQLDAEHIEFEWHNHAALWWLGPSSKLEHRPEGVAMFIAPRQNADVTTPPGDGQQGSPGSPAPGGPESVPSVHADTGSTAAEGASA